MKKKISIAAEVIVVLAIIGGIAFSAYRSSEPYRRNKAADTSVNVEEKVGDTTVTIDGIVYCSTKKPIPVEPDESVIVNVELPLAGSTSDEKVTAYAFISEEKPGDILVCLIDGEWYRFAETDRAGQP